jgi:hypothetical protein
MERVDNVEKVDKVERTDRLNLFYTLRKIAMFQPPPSMAIREEHMTVFRLPPSGRVPITVLGYAEDKKDKNDAESIELWIVDF